MGQKQSFILGGLGLIPFILILIACVISPPAEELYGLLLFIYVAYSAIISSFLGGIQWGLITAFADKIYYVFIPLFISVMPPLIAWAALLSIENLNLSLGLILVSFLISAVHDYYLYQQQKISQLWFITMRISLSSIVIVITSLMFLFVF